MMAHAWNQSRCGLVSAFAALDLALESRLFVAIALGSLRSLVLGGVVAMHVVDETMMDVKRWHGRVATSSGAEMQSNTDVCAPAKYLISRIALQDFDFAISLRQISAACGGFIEMRL
jgi:hypothetical protein